MSELKGQLLGVLLVLTIFGVLAAAFKGMFQNATNEISNRLTSEINQLHPHNNEIIIIDFIDM